MGTLSVPRRAGNDLQELAYAPYEQKHSFPRSGTKRQNAILGLGKKEKPSLIFSAGTHPLWETGLALHKSRKKQKKTKNNEKNNDNHRRRRKNNRRRRNRSRRRRRRTENSLGVRVSVFLHHRLKIIRLVHYSKLNRSPCLYPLVPVPMPKPPPVPIFPIVEIEPQPIPYTLTRARTRSGSFFHDSALDKSVYLMYLNPNMYPNPTEHLANNGQQNSLKLGERQRQGARWSTQNNTGKNCA